MLSLEGVFIHPTADIDPSARVGRGTYIWNNCQIRENAVIGEDCIIGKGAYIDQGVIVGDRCKVQNYACIYAGVILQSEVFIGPCATFTNDLYPRAFMRDWEIVKTTVGRGSSIGANCTIICGANIGEYAMIGAGSVLTRPADSFTLYVGNPATARRIIGKSSFGRIL